MVDGGFAGFYVEGAGFENHVGTGAFEPLADVSWGVRVGAGQ